MNPAPFYCEGMLPQTTRGWMNPAPSLNDAFERKRKLKYHGNTVRNLKSRIKSILLQEGAG
jgi:hypothetical protein